MHFSSRAVATLSLTCLLLTSCAPANQKNVYAAGEAGHDAVVMYGKIKSSRPVAVTGENSGAGMAVGAVGGGAIGSAIGSGNGTIAAVIAGAIIGGIAGAATEQSLANQQGIEYIIRFSETGDTRSIVQIVGKDEMPINNGECVMVQMNGKYQRVLPSNDPSDCPAPPKRKKQHVKTKLKNGAAETTIEHDN